VNDRMLTLDIATVGRLKQGAEQTLQERYLDRLQKSGPAHGIKSISIKEIPESQQSSTLLRKQDEADRLLKKTNDHAYLIALDEHGKELTSSRFAAQLKSQIEDGVQNICFLVGGPDGHDRTLLKKAPLTVSLSQMTLPHGLARIILLEQIYRAFTIWSGHPYHRS